MIPQFDPRSEQTRLDPYPLYRELRESQPVQHLVTPAGPDLWFVSRHAEVLEVLRDSNFSAAGGQRARQRTSGLPTTMLNTDEPDHGRLRSVVGPVMSAAALQRFQPAVDRLVARHADDLRTSLTGGAEVDLVDAFAVPLAADVLGRFLGVPEADLAAFSQWGEAVAAQLDPFADPQPDSPAERAMAEMLDRFADYLVVPAADSALEVLARGYADGRLSAGEVMSTVGLLVVGGLEPLADVLVSAIAVLLRIQRQPLADSEIRRGFEELLDMTRRSSSTARTAAADVTVGGCPVLRGHTVIALLGSANRDTLTGLPTRTRWSWTGGPIRHLAWGRPACLPRRAAGSGRRANGLAGSGRCFRRCSPILPPPCVDPGPFREAICAFRFVRSVGRDPAGRRERRRPRRAAGSRSGQCTCRQDRATPPLQWLPAQAAPPPNGSRQRAAATSASGLSARSCSSRRYAASRGSAPRPDPGGSGRNHGEHVRGPAGKMEELRALPAAAPLMCPTTTDSRPWCATVHPAGRAASPTRSRSVGGAWSARPPVRRRTPTPARCHPFLRSIRG